MRVSSRPNAEGELAKKAGDDKGTSVHELHRIQFGYEGNARGSILAILNFALLIVTTALVAVLYNGRSASNFLKAEAWSYTPRVCDSAAACVALTQPDTAAAESHNYNGTECGNDERACHLRGILPEFERPATGLFALSSVPVLLLSMQIIAAGFSMIFVHYAMDEGLHGDSNGGWLRKGLKRLAMLVVITYAGFFLFMQDTWAIPMNNLLFVEISFLLTLFYIGSNPSSAYTQDERNECMPARFVEMMLSVPLLVAAVLVSAGVYDSTEIVQAVFSVLFAYALLVGLECQRGAADKQYPETNSGDEMSDVAIELLFSSSMALVPFVVTCSDALNRADKTMWGQAALGLLLASVMLLQLTVGVFVIGRASGWFLEHWMYMLVVEMQNITFRAAILLTLLIGALSN